MSQFTDIKQPMLEQQAFDGVFDFLYSQKYWNIVTQ